ncbi:MAG: hypothetical protein HZC36_13785 [Armatimonadetes bacterium]|nr:hypothetical protein [Armatimonadota bacterium]
MDLNSLFITAAIAAATIGIFAWAYWYFNKVLWPIQRRKAVSRKVQLPTKDVPIIPVHTKPKPPGVL